MKTPTRRPLRRLNAALAVSMVLVAWRSLPLLAQVPPRLPTPKVGAVVVPSDTTSAQQAGQSMLGRTVSNAEIADAIRSSGLTQQQVRDRLARAGFDPSMADPFFNSDTATPAFQTGAATSSFAAALTELGILNSTDSLSSSRSGERRSARRAGTRSDVFGTTLFSNQGPFFDPVTAGPVDPSYRLGVGDQVQLVFTGDVEAAYPQLDVRRDGSIVVPQIGQVQVAGLTLDAAREFMRARAGRIYSGIASGRTSLDLSLGRIRSIQVYVVGEVEEPGAFQVSALGTVFTALARAGGPSDRGTFRRIDVRRGGKVASTVDLYDYLLSGDASHDFRLEQGDIILVPLNTRSIRVEGAVRRPGVFELRPEEGFRDLLRFAGGFAPDAALERLQIDRMLPGADRAPGRERAVLDVDLGAGSKALDTTKVLDGDVVRIFSIGDVRRDRVVISGEVYEPGVYHWKRGMTIGKLLEMAQGPLPWGLTDRVKVFRPVEPTGRTKIIDLDLTDSSSKWTRLSEFDSVVVLDGRLLFPSGTILVGGAVNEPGQHDFVEGQTLRDVIDLSGGLREDAYQVEVAREVRKTEFSDTSSIVRRFDIDSEFIKKTARLFRVERGDVVSVHAKPGYREPATVSLEGEFYLPGRYALQTSNERLASVIRRAGGILPTADSEAFRLIRSGRAVAVNLPKALVGDERDNIVLQPGDLLRVTRGTGTVQISGAVQREVLVPYNPSWSLDDYLAAAGGLARRADDDAIVVEYASGEVARRHRWLGITVSKPQIRTGATITVGTKEPSTDKWKDALTVASQAASLLASLVVAWSVARK